jgi:hypothetical protein
MAQYLPKILVDGMIISLVASAFLLLIMWVNPRIMLHDYPAAIQAKVPPKTEKEKQLSYWLGIPFIIILFAGPLISALSVAEQIGSQFLMLWLFTTGVMFIFNVFDWLILDWLIFCTITPKIMVIPGSEGMQAYKDYRFHFIGFLKGMVFCLLGGLIVAVIAYLV